MVLFPDGDDMHKAVMRIDEKDGIRFSFTVETPVLIRMKGSDDNRIVCEINGNRHSFTASGLSDTEIVPAVEILENSNKRSRYRITFTMDLQLPFELRAWAEDLVIT